MVREKYYKRQAKHIVIIFHNPSILSLKSLPLSIFLFKNYAHNFGISKFKGEQLLPIYSNKYFFTSQNPFYQKIIFTPFLYSNSIFSFIFQIYFTKIIQTWPNLLELWFGPLASHVFHTRCSLLIARPDPAKIMFNIKNLNVSFTSCEEA